MDDAAAPDSRGGADAAAAPEEQSIEVSAQPEIPDIVLTRALWRQIRSLQETEKEVQERLERQRVQQLIDKVEDEVEYEGILDDVCSRIRAEEEAMDVERRDREWELERREEELEEEVELLKDKIKRLEEELRLAQFGRSPESMIQSLLDEEGRGGDGQAERVVLKDIQVLEGGEGGGQSSLPNPTHEIIVAFEEMLREADERHEREKKTLEETVAEKEKAERRSRHERYEWRARFKQMESQMMVLEKEIGRASGLVKERDTSVAVERERRLAVEEEATKCSSLLKDERLAHKVAAVKLKKVEVFFSKLKDKVAKEIAENGNSSSFLAELEKEIGKVPAIFSVRKDVHKVTENEQFEAMKKQRDAAVAERDKLEDKLNRLLKRSRDREAEIDAMWLEREKLLIEKVTSLEEQTARYEEERAFEKRKWKQNAGDSSKDWEDEKFALEEAIRERDTALRAYREEKGRLLESKDSELRTLQTVHQQLLHDLALYKQNAEERTDSSVDPKPVQSTDQSCAKHEITRSDGIMSDEGNSKRTHSERSELEEKVVDTLSLVEELKCKMNEKETQMESERKQLETVINQKTAEIENLRRQLESKELEMKARVDKFRNEMLHMKQELENERRESENVLASKTKVAAEVQKRINETVEELCSLRLELREKSDELESMRREKMMEEARVSKLLAVQRELEDDVSALQRENAELSFQVQTSDQTEEATVKRNEEWQFALQKVVVFDKQISDAMVAIQNLREELSLKEAELQKARSDPEMELERREEAWTRERKRQQATYEQSVEAWKRAEQKMLAEKAELSKVLETERSESSDTIALLNGTIRELEWTLTRRDPDESLEHWFKSTPKGDMVKVRSSYLKEIDEYISGLKGKIEALERSKAKTTTTTREQELDNALLHIEKEMLSVSPDKMRSRLIKYSSPPSARTTATERSLHLMTTNSMFQPGTSSDRSWNLAVPLRDANTLEDRWTAQEALALTVATRQQKKWIVDTTWLDQVRKEHSFLTQQLAIERQRVAALSQVEAENQWMEAMMLRALEQKKECEVKLTQVQDKIASWSQKRSS